MADKSGIQCLDAGRTCGPQRRLEHRPEQAASTEAARSTSRRVNPPCSRRGYLRKKLGPGSIETVRRMDYRLAVSGAGRCARLTCARNQRPTSSVRRLPAPFAANGPAIAPAAAKPSGASGTWPMNSSPVAAPSSAPISAPTTARGARCAGASSGAVGRVDTLAAFARAQVNPALEPGLHAFLRESNLMTAHSRLTGGRDKRQVPVLSPARPGRRARRRHRPGEPACPSRAGGSARAPLHRPCRAGTRSHCG